VSRCRVLFVVHSASRNGASVLLLDFLRWLRTQVDWDLRVLICGTGPLLEDFRAVAPTTVWRSPGAKLEALFGGGLGRASSRAVDHVFRVLGMPRGRFDLIYANTSALAPVVPLLARRSKALLWHIHELEYALRTTLKGSDAIAALNAATRFVAVSPQVRQALVAQYGVRQDKVDVVSGFVRPGGVNRADRAVHRKHVLDRLQWPEDSVVIGGCGTLGWRKGSDLFLQAARALAADLNIDRARFLWVGGDAEGSEALEFERDVHRLGLEKVCRRVASTAEVIQHFCAFDVFALTSREDPFPLVMLEAADLALPMVCFEGTGGSNDFVAGGGGVMVRYADSAAFAVELAQLCASSAAREQHGGEARRHLGESHRVEVKGPALLRSMRACLALPASEPPSSRLNLRALTTGRSNDG
jgi:glycosyltransferase involved in cell wall biosynthesis